MHLNNFKVKFVWGGGTPEQPSNKIQPMRLQYGQIQPIRLQRGRNLSKQGRNLSKQGRNLSNDPGG
jgi:hypothetical protein